MATIERSAVPVRVIHLDVQVEANRVADFMEVLMEFVERQPGFKDYNLFLKPEQEAQELSEGKS